jgi:hypothetical protein
MRTEILDRILERIESIEDELQEIKYLISVVESDEEILPDANVTSVRKEVVTKKLPAKKPKAKKFKHQKEIDEGRRRAREFFEQDSQRKKK